MDLLDFFTGRLPWGKFWRLLSQLGADSRFIKAQQDDPDVAEMIAAEQVAEEIEAEKRGVVLQKWRPAPADWTLERELLAGIRDRLGEVAALVADLPVGVKTRHKPPPAFPRPETEMDRARRRKRAEYEAAEDERIMDEVERAKARWRVMQDQQAQETSDALDH